jgi:chromate transporter
MVYNGALGAGGAAVATIAIFLPSFLLIAAIAPFYTPLAASPVFARALAGANASVVGLLASAFVTPIWTNAIHKAADGIFAAAAFILLTLLRWPAWVVVALAAGAGAALFK